jgi:protein-tyrosine phosphatase
MTIWNAIYNTLFYNVNEIIPGLWLGNQYAPLDVEFLKQKGITFIVNCTPHTKIVDPDTGIETLRLPIYDSQLERDMLLMEEYFKTVIPILKQKILEHQPILIHCVAGKQRSAILVAGLLFDMLLNNNIRINNSESIKHDRKQLSKLVFDFIVLRRPQAFTYGFRVNFMKAFKRHFKI